MKALKIETMQANIPLLKPFKTALRTVHEAQSVIVKLTCDNGIVGWGEAPPTSVITGDTIPSIQAYITECIRPFLIGRDLLAYEAVFHDIAKLAVRNYSGRAAIDMAIYDCLSQNCGLPLYRFLGGYRDELETDFTVSVNSPDEMGEDALRYKKAGFRILKIKVGKDEVEKDIKRVEEIRRRVGSDVTIRLDANQGWKPKEAIRAIRQMEDRGLEIELVEQPVHAEDMEGLKKVTDGVDTLIMADESVFTPRDAARIIGTRSADLINIKLMKAGGIHQAQIINRLAEVAGMECMMGSMIETHIGITAAAHLAAGMRNITRYDFDAPLMLKERITEGGIAYEQARITFSQETGLGIRGVRLP